MNDQRFSRIPESVVPAKMKIMMKASAQHDETEFGKILACAS
jgi:hypothetical protein